MRHLLRLPQRKIRIRTDGVRISQIHFSVMLASHGCYRYSTLGLHHIAQRMNYRDYYYVLQTLQTAPILIRERERERERENISTNVKLYILSSGSSQIYHNLNISQKRFPNILQTVSTAYQRNAAIETIRKAHFLIKICGWRW